MQYCSCARNQSTVFFLPFLVGRFLYRCRFGQHHTMHHSPLAAGCARGRTGQRHCNGKHHAKNSYSEYTHVYHRRHGANALCPVHVYVPVHVYTFTRTHTCTHRASFARLGNFWPHRQFSCFWGCCPRNCSARSVAVSNRKKKEALAKMTQAGKLRRRTSSDVLKRQKRHEQASKQMRVGKMRIKAKKADQKLLNYQVSVSPRLISTPSLRCSCDSTRHRSLRAHFLRHVPPYN